ncbi:tryptophan halogenase family protein [Luteolibacter luteus]|uniref:Tryptophan 7-halogenase n=1 Tax=Luteolibacter luteus TaxID=2728835 RepID=A0A858RJH4_9BACT|nr:tryptophan halogenase family protein [Luteolibacter luteus]QJE96628.1 tryptophan 7-halogenase [Luteolibacter luteus]
MVSLPDPDPSSSASPEIRSVLVLGGGSAGLLAALTLKRMHPSLAVTVVHSSEIGTIGVGEGTTAVFPAHLFETLGISKEEFYTEAQPTWKQGIRFLWGPRDEFFYDFEFQYDQQFQGLPKPTGYYARMECTDLSQACALMQRNKAFTTGPLGKPVIKGQYAFHIENHRLVTCLETIARRNGVEFADDTLDRTMAADGQVTALHFKSGEIRTADLYIDASGFRAELIGKALEEPFNSFSGSLFCDRAVIGGWERTDEPIAPYTTAETMDHGWCWQIEHETFINRGYVYSSQFVSDADAEAELLAKNPKISTTPRIVKFRSGRYERNWVGNVVAVGNASGFVEPLEATALAQIIYESRWLAESLRRTAGKPDDAMRASYNRIVGIAWDEIRDFLAFHYKFNTRLETPFWKHCRENTSLGNYEDLYRLYRELGPNPALLAQALPARPNIYGVEGFLAMLVGMQVHYDRLHLASGGEMDTFNRHRQGIAAKAKNGLSVREALDAIRRPSWQWT